MLPSFNQDRRSARQVQTPGRRVINARLGPAKVAVGSQPGSKCKNTIKASEVSRKIKSRGS